MRRLTLALGGLALLGAALACDLGPGIEGPNSDNISRNWELTKCVYRSPADPTQRVDLVADGWVIVLYVSDNGFFRYSYTAPGAAEAWIDGGWRIAGNKLILAPAGAPYEWQFTARVGESSMTLKGGSAEFDFDGDGTPDPAIWDMTMRN